MGRTGADSARREIDTVSLDVQPGCSPVGQPAPLKVGPYLVTGELGQGGCGTVYRAVHDVLGQPVALKVLHHRADTMAAERFRREARLGAQLRHPCVVAVHNAGAESDGTCWIAMDLVEGLTAWRLVRERGPLTPSALAPFLADLAEALSVAHTIGVAHRDISPGNVMVSLAGHRPEPRLLDLGLARWDDGLAPLTDTNVAMGTPGYASPEQRIDAASAGPPADQYALGRLVTFLLCGRPDLGSTPLGVPIQEVLQRATDPDPSRRYPTVLAFAAEFARAVAESASHPVASVAAEYAGRFHGGGAFHDLRAASSHQLFRRSTGLAAWADGELHRAERAQWIVLDDAEGTWRADPVGLCSWRLDAPTPNAVDGRIERRPQLKPDATRLLGLVVQAGGELDLDGIGGQWLSPARRELAVDELERHEQARRLSGTRLLVCPAWARPPERLQVDVQRDFLSGIARSAAGSLDTARIAWRAALRVGEPTAIIGTTRRLVDALAVQDGLVEPTLAVLHAAETLADGAAPAAAELIALATDLTLGEPTAPALARLQVLLDRVDARAAGEARLLLTLFDRTARGRALDGLPTPDALSDPRLGARAWSIRVFGAKTLGDLSAALEGAERWFDAHWDDGERSALFLRMRSWEALRGGRNLEAAAFAGAALEMSRSAVARVDALLGAASAHLELGHLAPAIDAASQAREQARLLLSPHRLLRATYLERAARCRSGEPLQPRQDLVDDSASVGGRHRARLILTEATIAARVGADPERRALAALAVDAMGGVDSRCAVAFARCLGADALSGSDRLALLDELRALAQTDLLPGDVSFLLQGAALLTRLTPELRLHDLASRLRPLLRTPDSGRPRDLYSTREAVQLLERAAASAAEGRDHD